MAFGPIMQLKIGELEIELAPLKKEDMEAFVSPGMQQDVVTRFIGVWSAPVLEDEHEWFEKIRKEKNSLIWGIFDVSNQKRIAIGTTGISDISFCPGLAQAESGMQIFNQEYWGKGIASHIHKARAWYMFVHFGLYRIKSGVLRGNFASLKALEKSGYRRTFVERNFAFANGKLRHLDSLECLNPNEPFWSQWWGSDKPTKASLQARDRTLAALDWAQQNVTLL